MARVPWRWTLVLGAIMVMPAFAADKGTADPASLRVENGLRPPAIAEGQRTWSIAERMAYYKVPGVSIAVIAHGKVEWARGYGVTAVGGPPVNKETLFQAASISKPLTALMALSLVDEGKLSLDEDVNLKLRSWKVPENEFTKGHSVTLRELLNHSAGMTVHGFPGYEAGKKLPSLLDILAGSGAANTPPIRGEIIPDTAFSYSGGGYIVVQQLAMDVTGKPFPQLMQERVLTPLGMTHSTFEQPLPDSLEANAAAAHTRDGKMIEGRWHTYPEMAAAGLWTTPSDLARVVLELQHGSHILKPATQAEMLTGRHGDYGLGIGLGNNGGRKSVSHNGGNAGFLCQMFGYLDGSGGAVVMTNSDVSMALTSEIMRSLAAEYGWADYLTQHSVRVDATTLQAYVGHYSFPHLQLEIDVTVEDGKAFAVASGKKDELLATSPTDFIAGEAGWPPAHFTRSADGTIEMTMAGMVAKRLGKAN